ncbi:TIGR00730 family Rossman fold protein [Listeria aquatica]|uniref:Cytokinin riboside 5'-monophosphate phosphoribohydrolase n=1 Tax=Listeria aquatica TaxID=1494960 RepID=A0A841ZNN2_9LIST|nr:TIGR00730 family Rossman fold protein [Listeria aquatica]MBC1521763.1 TIGR00730 family Rossman fold protein [Listeria aquatica]
MKIAVYCGSAFGAKKIYQESAEKIGNWIGENEYTLVYGGGNVGLMGVVADTVLSHGAAAYGVMPTFLEKREIAHRGLTRLIQTKDMYERKKTMMELADAYIALPGGPGTLEEISEVISLGRIGVHKNPCILYNVDGYYEPLRSFFDEMVTADFLTEAAREQFLFSDSLPEIEDFIANFKPNKPKTYQKRKTD